MVGSLLLRGMLVGLVAGLVAFGFARVFGEPAVDYAIGFEAQGAGEAHVHSHGGGGEAAHSHDAPDEELFSRETQAGIGLLTGILVYGTAVGGLFSLACASGFGRFGGLSPRGVAALLALAGFVALVLVPQLKYPANPPAVGSPETIAERTELFFLMLAASLAALAAGFWTRHRLASSSGAWTAALAGGAAFLAVVVVAATLLPAVDEVPDGFSGSMLWRFRMASLGIHAVLWTVLGLGFGALAERLLRTPPRARHMRAVA